MAVDPIRDSGDPQTRVAGVQTGVLFERHARMVYGLCRALLRNPDDAEDATQATFVAAYTSLLGGRKVRQPAAWLATIARHECTSRAHARMREPLPLLEVDLSHMHGPEAELNRKESVEELQQAIAELPSKQREAVVLRDLYGLPYAEVSLALGMSVASVESLLFRARRSLRISLRPLAGGALAVPLEVREGIAQALPAFTPAGAAGGGAASGAIGLGLFTKLAGGPAAVKVAACLVAVTAVSSVAVVEHAAKPQPRGAQADAFTPQDASDPSAGSSRSVPVVARTRPPAVVGDSGVTHTGGGGRATDQGSGPSRREDAGGTRNDGAGKDHKEPDVVQGDQGAVTGASSSVDDESDNSGHSTHGDAVSSSAGLPNDGEQGDAGAPPVSEDNLLRSETFGAVSGEHAHVPDGEAGPSNGHDVPEDTGPSTDSRRGGSESGDAASERSGESGSDGGSHSGSDDGSHHDPAVTTPPPA